MGRSIVLFSAVLLLALFGAGCSSSDSPGESGPPSQSPNAGSSGAAVLGPAKVRQAEQAVKNELPDIPLWEGVQFTGVAFDDSAVCVDRTYPEDGGLDGKGGSAGYVLVRFPGVTLGEPQDGVCSGARTEPSTSAPPALVPEEVKDSPGLVTRDDLGEEWPLSVDYVVLACDPMTAGGRSLQVAYLTAPDGLVYALNGSAKAHTNHADIEPIWADSSDMEGLKVNIGPLINRALTLC